MPFDNHIYWEETPFNFGLRGSGHFETYDEPTIRRRIRWVSHCEECFRRLKNLEERISKLEGIESNGPTRSD